MVYGALAFFFISILSSIFNNFFLLTSNYLFFSTYFNVLPLILLISGGFFFFLSYVLSFQRITVSFFSNIIFLSFLPLVYLFISTNNVLVFFMCYEYFLLPSFLIVFFNSPNRRGVVASIYFLMWTQVGSFLVFVSIMGFIFFYNTYWVYAWGCSSTSLTFIALVGFGIKIPVWPAHYWLTKTHVEAPTYFSIYLSGFLVKTALYGVWIFINTPQPLIQYILIVLGSIGVIDSSVKMWGQVDLKKLVAYGTIQEMNMILIGFSVGSLDVVKYVSLFILAHTILSTIFFLIVDSLYRRYSSRSILVIRGVINASPQLGSIIILAIVLFAGLPLTLKFSVEVCIFNQLLLTDFGAGVIMLVVCNWIGLVCFSKHWLLLLFGTNKHVLTLITFKEKLLFTNLFLLLVILTPVSFIF